MNNVIAFRGVSNNFVRLTVAMGSGGQPTSDGKIKAAGCGTVGRLKSVAGSAPWREAQPGATACQLAQLIGLARFRAPRKHPRYEPR